MSNANNSQKAAEHITTSNNLMPAKPPPGIDGFNGFEDAVEGSERQAAGPIVGTLIRFSNTAEWQMRDGEVLSANAEYVAIDIVRVAQKWSKDHQPVETIILAPGQKFPDIVKMNEAIPEEWIEGPDGKKRGPWQAQHIVYLLDPATMDRYSFATGTFGGAICCRDLADKVKWARKFHAEPSLVPVVTLSDTYMHTRFGGRQRPHFFIKRWISFGSGGALPDRAERPALTVAGSTNATTAVKPAAANAATAEKKPIETPEPHGTAKVVAEPSLAEEMRDAIVW